MAFTETDKLKAMAIVNIFETGEAFGNYSSLTVLDDGAGISYGINQFTHKSGSLAAVVDRYLKLGGKVERSMIEARAALLRKKTKTAIESLANDEIFKDALRSAANSREMHEAQNEIALEIYLKPAVDVCEAKGFSLPLSLAVVYDSIIHGSWEKVAANVRRSDGVTGRLSEKEWITEYVRQRDKWLAGSSRLRETRYRTQFFQQQINHRNWSLELPVIVHGKKLTDETVALVLITEPAQMNLPLGIDTNQSDTANDQKSRSPSDVPATTPSDDLPEILPDSPETNRPQTRAVPADPPAVGNGRNQENEDSESCIDKAEEVVNEAAAKYDQAERIVKTVIARNDSAKSLWTTVAGTIWQTVWGVAGFLSGMPRVVWLVVAVIAGALMIGYLYRQIALGRIREKSEAQERQNQDQKK